MHRDDGWVLVDDAYDGREAGGFGRTAAAAAAAAAVLILVLTVCYWWATPSVPYVHTCQRYEAGEDDGVDDDDDDMEDDDTYARNRCGPEFLKVNVTPAGSGVKKAAGISAGSQDRVNSVVDGLRAKKEQQAKAARAKAKPKAKAPAPAPKPKAHEPYQPAAKRKKEDGAITVAKVASL